MTGTKISALSSQTGAALALADLLATVDVSDVTTVPAGAGGSDKKITVQEWMNGVVALGLGTQLGIPPSLQVLLGSIDVPRRSLDRFRGAPNGVDTTFASGVTSTATTITTNNQNLVLPGEYPVIGLVTNGVTEQVQVVRGQGTATLSVIRHVNGTTAAAHSAGDAIVRDKVRNVPYIGDSSAQGTVTGVTGVWDDHVSRARRIFNDRFGGSLGHGFYGLWRDTFLDANCEWTLTGSWFTAIATDAFNVGPWLTKYALTSSDVATWKRPANVTVGQIDVWYAVLSNGTANVGTEWSYSTDGGSTWTNNPQSGVDPHPTSTTTLGSADNGRRCDYWDGTKTMTLASVTGIENNAGFWLLDVGSGASSFKCRALFTYDGVSGSTLTNVKYVGPAHYNALTTSTGDTAQKRPEIRKASITVSNPTDFRIRGANAAGTNKVAMIVGVDVWSSPFTFGVSRGLKVHNFGYSSHGLGDFLTSRMVTDIGTTNGSASITSAGRASFAAADVGSQIINANLPANTVITAVADATHATVSNNATASVTAGATLNLTTIQGMRGQWDMAFNGSPVSLNPALIIHGFWCVDSLSNYQGAPAAAVNATFVSGSANVTLTSGTVEPLDVGATFIDTALAACPNKNTIASYIDSTHITITPPASANATAVTARIGAGSAAISPAISDKLSIFTNGGIGSLGGVSPYADQILLVQFEQGGSQLTGYSSTSTLLATYRAALHTWATANKIATIDIYQAWALEGNVGYAAAAADGLMDASDAAQLHPGPVGCRDIASRVTRLLEFA